MKSEFVSDLQPNQDVTSAFLVQTKDVRLKKTGEPYLSLTLADKTGDIDAKMWDNVADVIQTFDRDDFVKVKGRVQVYQNRPQFTIHRLARIGDEDVNFADFFPASQRDPDEMFAELRQVINGIGNQHIRALLDALMDDPQIGTRFKQAPAAKTVHHAYLGGLLEHVLSLCQLCKMTAAHYPIVDLDLLLAGAVIHDIGKIDELSYRRSFSYTDEGQLLGHIIIGLRMVEDKLRGLPGFPPKLRTLLEHILLSHHGQLDFGSPKIPYFPEALLFHLLDNLDSKMENVRVAIDQDSQIEGHWTRYVPPLERYLLKKDSYLAAGESAPEPGPPPPLRPAASQPVQPPPAAPAAADPPRPAQFRPAQPPPTVAPAAMDRSPIAASQPVQPPSAAPAPADQLRPTQSHPAQPPPTTAPAAMDPPPTAASQPVQPPPIAQAPADPLRPTESRPAQPPPAAHPAPAEPPRTPKSRPERPNPAAAKPPRNPQPSLFGEKLTRALEPKK